MMQSRKASVEPSAVRELRMHFPKSVTLGRVHKGNVKPFVVVQLGNNGNGVGERSDAHMLMLGKPLLSDR